MGNPRTILDASSMRYHSPGSHAKSPFVFVTIQLLAAHRSGRIREKLDFGDDSRENHVGPLLAEGLIATV
jgi:hypothetical protein